jgi:large subunit ribosomal protein L15
MQLNTLKPADGAKFSRKRVGRGIGSGYGKTCGRGHKGQHSRKGGYHKTGFEGGQMPIQRRLPKIGFSSRIGLVTAQVCLHELNMIDAEEINIDALKKANIIKKNMKRAKVVFSGEISKAIKLVGIKVTKGAKEAIEKAGGSVVEPEVKVKKVKSKKEVNK